MHPPQHRRISIIHAACVIENEMPLVDDPVSGFLMALF
jgi:hypothetical protein